MVEFTPISSLVGGILIGLASSVLLLTHGRVTGVSGIAGATLSAPTRAAVWRLAFLVGLLLAGLGAAILAPTSVTALNAPPLGWIIVAGLLVGFGTRLGSGCTSGHGVCGVSRLSPRSLVATATFIAAGMVTVFVVRVLTGAA